jgi:hypothetical protein
MFTGTVPNSYGDLEALSYLSLSKNNGLNGALPQSFAGLTNLGMSYLSIEDFIIFTTADIVLTLPNVFSIVEIDIRETGITGAIPSSICDENNKSAVQIQVDCNVSCSCCICQA